MFGKGKRQDTRLSDVTKAYQKLFNTEDGTTVLYDLLKHGYFLRPTFDKQGDSAALRNEGRREMCIYILEKMGTDISKLLVMLESEKTIEQQYFNV